MAIRVNFCISIGMAIATSLFSAIAITPAARSNDAGNQKLGTVRALPSLQTRAHPPLQPDTLHLGMLEPQFFKYAQDNNWAAIATIHRDEYTMHQLQPARACMHCPIAIWSMSEVSLQIFILKAIAWWGLD